MEIKVCDCENAKPFMGNLEFEKIVFRCPECGGARCDAGIKKNDLEKMIDQWKTTALSINESEKLIKLLIKDRGKKSLGIEEIKGKQAAFEMDLLYFVNSKLAIFKDETGISINAIYFDMVGVFNSEPGVNRMGFKLKQCNTTFERKKNGLYF